MNKKILWITQTAVFIAVLIILQVVSMSLGNTLITGSIVNSVLITSVMACGYSSGLAVAVISPIMAKFIGIGPLWSLIPFIAVGNIILISFWNFIGNQNTGRKYITYIIALISAAAAKFLVLYVGIVKIAIPVFLGLPEQQASIISNMFSIPQLITALMGGVLAMLLLPVLKKAIKERQ